MHFVVLGIALDHMVEMEIATFGKSIECRAVAVERSVRLHVGYPNSTLHEMRKA